ncbi:N-terminal glutamine amidase [Cyclobacterium xiamenense]|uniref:Protein N-terminal glutamine amidohydrolase n=1 Tax=Cyclobacterium xiamenense TaxID=1297121 RepID=A0A1H6UCM1_9BACT|nr:hypothetical protein [Cyclobacterium xiamenense]SEI87407.1 N-terminal glutamine amidase [Cyclobacterium xiamenense]
MGKETFKYVANYCEENIWQLCRHPVLAETDKRVVIVSNQAGNCSFWQQQSMPDSGPVCWDYHVVLLAFVSGEWCVYDFDSKLEFPVGLASYLECTFRPTQTTAANAPFFKVFPGDEFTRTLSSDRSHMKNAVGNWIFQPPAWDAIESDQFPGLHLNEIRDFSPKSPHRVLSLDELKAAFVQA